MSWGGTCSPICKNQQDKFLLEARTRQHPLSAYECALTWLSGNKQDITQPWTLLTSTAGNHSINFRTQLY